MPASLRPDVPALAPAIADEECAEVALRVLLQTLDAGAAAVEPAPGGLDAALACCVGRRPTERPRAGVEPARVVAARRTPTV